MKELILVTGGCGFIGSHVVDQLVAMELPVRVLDRLLPTAHSGRPDYLNPRAEYVWGDIQDPDAVSRSLEGAGAVSHQAAMVGLGVDMNDVEEYVRYAIPYYVAEGKSYLTLGIGCTGGRHRSVMIAERLRRALAHMKGAHVRVRHRDIGRE